MISSKDHPLIKHIVRLRLNNDYRHECKRVVVEGEKLVLDLCHRMPFHHLLVKEGYSLPATLDSTHVTLLSEEVMKKASGLPTPPALMAEVDLPADKSLKGLKWLVALDGVQDPGNVGTLLRTALGLGWEGAVLLPQTADPFNEKVIRAAQGASFFLPFQHMTHEQFQTFCKGRIILGADMNGENVHHYHKKGDAVLVLGSEGQGISDELKKLCKAVSVPMTNQVESLNVAVAGGILMTLLRNV